MSETEKQSTTSVAGRHLRIPVNFGHIAAIEWGPSDGVQVLALHGWQDNAQSFAPLAARLVDSNVRLLAIDLPGHGLSSHLGRSAIYTHLQYASAVWQVVQQLRWDTFTLIGHSMGGVVAIVFTGLFPQRVTNLLTLDSVYPQLPQRDKTHQMHEVISRMLSLEEREFKPPMEVNWEEARKSFSEPRALSQTNVDILIERSLRPGSRAGLFVFNRDHRIRMLGSPQFKETQPEVILGQFSKFHGRWLALMANSAKLRRNADKLKLAERTYPELMPSFQVIVVPDEGHYFHMELPELVAPHLMRLLEQEPPSPLSKL